MLGMMSLPDLVAAVPQQQHRWRRHFSHWSRACHALFRSTQLPFGCLTVQQYAKVSVPFLWRAADVSALCGPELTWRFAGFLTTRKNLMPTLRLGPITGRFAVPWRRSMALSLSLSLSCHFVTVHAPVY
jgi:hypothetical protein